MGSKTKSKEAEFSAELAVVPDTGGFLRMKQHYLTQNLKPGITKPYTLNEVAKAFNVTVGHVRNISSRFKWNEELRALQENRNQQAVQVVQNFQLVNEVEIRTRQAEYARTAMTKAIQKIQTIDPLKLTVKEAVELLKLGLQEERRALGLVESVTYQVPANEKDAQKLGAVQRAMAIIDRLANRDESNVVSG
jgi:hypothetical protein